MNELQPIDLDEPMSLEEIADRVSRAAMFEMFSINIMECSAARVGAPFVYSKIVVDIRQQGRALGLAHEVMKALQAKPDLALGLDITGLMAEAGPAPGPVEPELPEATDAPILMASTPLQILFFDSWRTRLVRRIARALKVYIPAPGSPEFRQ